MTKFGTAGLALAGILAVTAASVTDASAQWRGHRHGGGWGPGIGIGAGIAAGALIGSAVAARPYGYYDGGYYGSGYYSDGYYDAPVAAVPYYGGYRSYGGWGNNSCYEGYRRVPCTQGGGF